MVADLEQLTIFDQDLPHHDSTWRKDQNGFAAPAVDHLRVGYRLQSFYRPQSLTLRNVTLDLTSEC